MISSTPIPIVATIDGGGGLVMTPGGGFTGADVVVGGAAAAEAGDKRVAVGTQHICDCNLLMVMKKPNTLYR